MPAIAVETLKTCHRRGRVDRSAPRPPEKRTQCTESANTAPSRLRNMSTAAISIEQVISVRGEASNVTITSVEVIRGNPGRAKMRWRVRLRDQLGVQDRARE